MAKRKVQEVSKFGGVDELGNVALDKGIISERKDNYDVKSLEVQSKTNLEDDTGYGGAAIVRMFEFGINPQVFNEVKPTRQQLFNAHSKGIEIALWRDGMSVMPEVQPRIVIDEKSMTYKIFVGAKPMKGHLLKEKPKTLTELVHGNGNLN